MELDDLTTEKIIEEIKKHKDNKSFKAKTNTKGYLYFDNTKLSPTKIFINLGIERPYTTSRVKDSNMNIYTKLLTILPKLNDENIYLHIASSYNMPKKYKDRYESQLHYLPNEENIKPKEKASMIIQPLNQILYGPPGTGKTYNTIDKALEIIDGEVPQNREEAKKRFKELREAGQIEFVTFHQSYGYEEFVEGIRADVESDEISYNLENGIFKNLCKKATTKSNSNFNDKIDELKEKIITNGAFDITYNNNIYNINYRGGKTFRIKPQKSSNQNTDYPASIENIRKLYEDSNRKDIYNPTYVKGILEYLYDSGLQKYNDIQESEEKKYILIIDEINRGNISKIFGELITLIEPSKRIGENEELKLTLPNSKELFGVPKNLYIIGTMNTADRSIAQIDTALRRRFKFVEMMPKPELLNGIIIDEIDVQKVLEAINERIEQLYDREHTIGHSYFLPLIETPTKDKLDKIFEVNIIPLLAEYFYGDWADIIIILNNNGFIQEKELKYPITTSRANKVYQVSDTFSVESYQKIYEQ